ncbi:ABC transporter ATP-binding protein [Kangiella sediminilitoris]|uniref:ABC transporter n=1 Tax=Kangiella sediminilitoris TaxID=1144748 RepID=A0A1B3BCT0_9GAMM|nr:ABC transporter ATP-binding protein [Kangiella sediminilitoris]AOE50547.1 ABC transporter [Kangiella sediminilitoris]
MTKALSIKDLCKTYDNGTQALKGINLEVEEGDFFALLGPNGAGKSTAIGIITSLVNKSAGKVEVFGHDIDKDLANAKKQLGLVPQEFNFNMFEGVEQIVVQQAGYYGISRNEAKKRAQPLLEQLGLWDKRDAQSRELSGGMKRRLMIARGLIHDPKLLILDEPTAGVDIELRRSMWDFMQELNREKKTTIVLTTHYLEEAESLCRNIAIINHGEIAENTSMKELLAKLDMETFVLDTTGLPAQMPTIDGYEVRVRDETTIEVDVHKGAGVNGVFDELSKHDITVLSMRNKANRLEELFVRLVENPHKEATS